MRTVANYFLVNLSVANLLMCSLNCTFNFIYTQQLRPDRRPGRLTPVTSPAARTRPLHLFAATARASEAVTILVTA